MTGTSCLSKLNQILAWLFVVLFFLLCFNPCYALLRTKLTGDDASYVSHGFTLGLDFNLGYHDMIADWTIKEGSRPAHPIGPGLLAAPFIAGFSIIDKIQHHPVIADHKKYLYSWSLFGFVFATFFYSLLGVYLYIKALDCLALKLSTKSLLFCCSSFGLLSYVLFRPISGHAYEFFTLALCFWSSAHIVRKISQNTISYGYLFICAFSMIMTLLIRPANLNVFLLPVIVLGLFWPRPTSPTLALKTFSSLFVLVLVCLIPFCVLNQTLYGMIFPSIEAMYGPHENRIPAIDSILVILLQRLPKLMNILFSSEFGLIFSSTLLVFGPILLISRLIKPFNFTLIPVALYIALPLVIVLFWQNPGEMYGYRFLFCLFPIALLGFAYWSNSLKEKYQKLLFYPTSAQFILIFILVLGGCGILGTLFWGLNEDFMYYPGRNAFGVWGPTAMGYNVRVIEAIPKFSVWMELIQTRTIGFFAQDFYGQLPKSSIDLFAHYHCQFQQTPFQSKLQVLILGLFFIISCLFFLKKDKT